MSHKRNVKKANIQQFDENTFKEIRKNLSDKSNTLSAFKEIAAALQSILISLEDEDARIHFTKKNANRDFNTIVQICLSDVPPALIRVFNIEGNKIKNEKKYKKMEEKINSYLLDLITLSKSITESVARTAIVKMGILPLVELFKSNKKISSELVKQFVIFWSTGAESLKITSFLVIYKVCQSLPETAQESIIKSMYEAYIRNCKFNSPESLPLITFMRASLTEMYLINEAIAYKQAFLYTRQMAIHLRNASTKNNQETLQIVYSWQFVHALHLWCEVLAMSHPSKCLEPLIHPVVQIAIGLMSVKKTATFYPLILTVCKILTTFSGKTKVFIPVLTHLLEILESNHWSKKKTTEKYCDINWNCILSVSKGQLDKQSYVTDFVPLVLDCIVEYMTMESASVGFPELTFPLIQKWPTIIQNLKNSDLIMEMKAVIAKIKTNADFIEARRANITFKFSDIKAVRLWEIETSQNGTPLSATIKSKKRKLIKSKKRNTPMPADKVDSENREV